MRLRARLVGMLPAAHLSLTSVVTPSRLCVSTATQFSGSSANRPCKIVSRHSFARTRAVLAVPNLVPVPSPLHRAGANYEPVFTGMSYTPPLRRGDSSSAVQHTARPPTCAGLLALL
jgi:hypothetical protein